MPKIIDAHTHIGLERFIVRPIPPEKLKLPALREPLENTIEALLSRLDAHGIRRAIAFPFPLAEIDAASANDYVLEAFEAFPNRILPFALIGDDAEYWLLRGVQGFKQHGLLQSPERFDLQRAYKVLAEAKAPLIVHFDRSKGSIPDQAREIVRVAPGIKVIVAHMGRKRMNTAIGVEDNLVGLRDEPDIFLETSTVRDSHIIPRAIELLGEDRLVFGSDYPYNSYLDADPLAVELQLLQTADLPPHVRSKILGENVLRCFSASPDLG